MTDLAAVARRALACLDLTNLNDDCDLLAIEELCGRAVLPAGRVAAVCVYPHWVPEARALLGKSGVRVATVANFPAGGTDAAAAAETTRLGFANGADEVDVVIPYRALAAGDEKPMRAVLAACRKMVPRGMRLKAILETGELKDGKLIAKASAIALEEGADFIKTSTGKVPVNATLEAARIMLEAIRASGHKAGLKPSGGIRTTEEAARYLALADEIMGPAWAGPETFRFGASGLLDDLLKVLGGAASGKALAGTY